jgi:hypothetical protein
MLILSTVFEFLDFKTSFLIGENSKFGLPNVIFELPKAKFRLEKLKFFDFGSPKSESKSSNETF